MQEKTYDEKILGRLLPHYDFYLDKGISEKVLGEYRCGLATGGDMYQRLVFPIYNREGKIHGFSGRDMTNSDTRPKWKHLGRANNWFYPFYSCKKVADQMCDTQTVYIVESIGDSLALSNAGYYNNLVAFGINLSPTFVSKLAALDLRNIVIAFNNDSEKNNDDAGKLGALKTLIKLSKCFDIDCLHYTLIPMNDFGEMSRGDISKFVSSLSFDEPTIRPLIEFGEQKFAKNNNQFNILKRKCSQRLPAKAGSL